MSLIVNSDMYFKNILIVPQNSFAAHSSLIPLRKSKSALAGFTSHLGTSASHSKPLLCSKIVKEGINDSQEEIMEMIDLRKGDILQVNLFK